MAMQINSLQKNSLHTNLIVNTNNIVIVSLIDLNNNKDKKTIQVDKTNPPNTKDFLRIAKQKFNKKFKSIVLIDKNDLKRDHMTLYDPIAIINYDIKGLDLYFATTEINVPVFGSVNEAVNESVNDQQNSTKQKEIFFNIISKDSYIPFEAIKQLEELRNQFNDLTHLIGMPDLHQGRYPIGSVCISKNTIYPELVGTDIGCGMSLFCLDMETTKYSNSKVQKMARNLYLESDDPTFTDAIKYQYLSANNLKPTHLETIGTIGGGNHFCEMQEIHAIHDQELFNNYNLKSDNYYLIVHSGSRDLGTEILDKYIKKEIDINTYKTEHDNAIQWAKLNRQIIADRFISQLRHSGESLNGTNNTTNRCFDLWHNYVEETEHGFIHRKGAAPAYDKPIIIPGSRGALTYVVQPINSSEANGWSVAHGAGRKIARGKLAEGMKNKTASDRERSLEPSKSEQNISNLVICEKQDLLYEEAPVAYKDIDVVINDLVHFGLVKVIMTLKPVITYKCKLSCNCCSK